MCGRMVVHTAMWRKDCSNKLPFKLKVSGLLLTQKMVKELLAKAVAIWWKTRR